MKRFAALGAGVILLGGCALPVPVQVASWALDGISYLLTEKSVADHGLSVLAQKDCALLRGLLDPSEICRDFDDTATALADGSSYSNFVSFDVAADEDAAAIAEFETAAGGSPDGLDETPSALDVTEEGARTNARPILADGVETAAALVSAAVAFVDSASLDEYPAELVVLDEALDEVAIQYTAFGDVEDVSPVRKLADAIEDWKAHDEVAIQYTAFGDVEDVSPVRKLVDAIEDWKAQITQVAQTTRVADTGKEPAAGFYFVIGSVREHANARKLRSRYRVLTPSVLSAKLDKATVFRVVVGPFDQDQAKDFHKRIFRAGISDSWAIRVKPGEWSMAMVDPPAIAPVQVAVLGRSVEELADVGEWSNAVRYIRSLALRFID